VDTTLFLQQIMINFFLLYIFDKKINSFLGFMLPKGLLQPLAHGYCIILGHFGVGLATVSLLASCWNESKAETFHLCI